MHRGLTLTLLCFLPIGLVWAQLEPGMPVSDSKLQEIAQSIDDTLNNRINLGIAQQSEILRRVQNTLEKSLTGVGGVGQLNNLPAEQSFRNWTPTAEDLANMVQQGLQTGSLSDRLTYYNQHFPIPTAAQLTPADPKSVQANYGVFSAVSANAALTVSDKGFDQVKTVMDQLNYLYRQIDQQQSVKQSIDLNSVILLKIVALQAELIRLQAQQLKMQAVGQQEGNGYRLFGTRFIQNFQ